MKPRGDPNEDWTPALAEAVPIANIKEILHIKSSFGSAYTVDRCIIWRKKKHFKTLHKPSLFWTGALPMWIESREWILFNIEYL